MTQLIEYDQGFAFCNDNMNTAMAAKWVSRESCSKSSIDCSSFKEMSSKNANKRQQCTDDTIEIQQNPVKLQKRFPIVLDRPK